MSEPPPAAQPRLRLSPAGRFWFWGIAAILFLAAVWLLHGILLPFVAGMAIAYFLDPLAERLQRSGLSRSQATIVITVAFFLVALLVLVALVPVIGDQIGGFAQRVPGYVQTLAHKAEPLWNTIKARLSPHDIDELRKSASDYAGTIAGWAGSMARGLVGGSIEVANTLSLIFITPIVTFYLLRDWHRVTTLVDGWIPRRHAEVVHRELREINHILAGYVRGQALVCLTLAIIYGASLTAVGLDLGLVVGIGAGALSFIPYLGTLSGLIVGIALAIAQSQGADWTLPAEVAVVYVVGNQIEANFLAPRLVGRKIGLHPVWVIFALLAGSALFGFVGLLLALPAAAVIGVLARFGIAQYLQSDAFTGDSTDDGT